jgi:hypothetical protein
MALLETLVASIDRNHYEWVRDEPTQEDLDHILKESLGSPSPFDPLNLRAEVYNDLKSGKARLVTKRGPTAKVLAIVYPDTKIPWDTFGKIFQAFGEPARAATFGRPARAATFGRPARAATFGEPARAATFGEPARAATFGQAKGQKQWRLVWFANKKQRTLPNEPITQSNLNASPHIHSLHINGGYAFACQPETIVIYREEEAPRVLVHELLHAACTDDMNKPEEIREVLTESWAELFLIAIIATTPAKAKKLWAIQSQWIVDQETVLKGMGVNTPADYAWRYTVGRREVLEGLGLRFPQPSQDPAFMLGQSLRFTSSSLI